jgi:outer membrane protein OmpA-like peptidoglycan-associated protein
VPARKGGRTYAIAIAACLAAGLVGYFVWQGIRYQRDGTAKSGVTATTAPGVELHPVAADQLLSAEEKALVLSQIDLLSTLAPEKRDRLYNMVSRAKVIRKIVEMRFAEGQTDVPFPKEVEKLLTTEHVQKTYRDNLTAAFIVLGFCDSDSGDESNASATRRAEWEREISQVRAMNVVRIMQSTWKIPNVIHGLPMGNGRMTPGESIDPKKAGTAEIWAALP